MRRTIPKPDVAQAAKQLTNPQPVRVTGDMDGGSAAYFDGRTPIEIDTTVNAAAFDAEFYIRLVASLIAGTNITITDNMDGTLTIASTGGGGTPGGSSGEVQYNNAGAFGGLTAAQLTALIDDFTSTLSGAVPPPTTVTGKYLKDDGTWDTPSGGSGLWAPVLSTTPTASNTSLSNLVGTGAASSDLSTGLYIAGTSGGVGAYTTSVPGTPYSITALIAPADGGPCSLGWTDGTKYQFIYPSIYAGGTLGNLDVQNNSTLGAFASTASNAARKVYGPLNWFRIRDDGTTVYFQFSYDGVHFITHYSVAKASGYLGSGGYTHIFAGVPGGSGVQGVMILSWTQGV